MQHVDQQELVAGHLGDLVVQRQDDRAEHAVLQAGQLLGADPERGRHLGRGGHPPELGRQALLHVVEAAGEVAHRTRRPVGGADRIEDGSADALRHEALERHAARLVEAARRLHQAQRAGAGELLAIDMAGVVERDLEDDVADEREVTFDPAGQRVLALLADVPDRGRAGRPIRRSRVVDALPPRCMTRRLPPSGTQPGGPVDPARGAGHSPEEAASALRPCTRRCATYDICALGQAHVAAGESILPQPARAPRPGDAFGCAFQSTSGDAFEGDEPDVGAVERGQERNRIGRLGQRRHSRLVAAVEDPGGGGHRHRGGDVRGRAHRPVDRHLAGAVAPPPDLDAHGARTAVRVGGAQHWQGRAQPVASGRGEARGDPAGLGERPLQQQRIGEGGAIAVARADRIGEVSELSPGAAPPADPIAVAPVERRAGQRGVVLAGAGGAAGAGPADVDLVDLVEQVGRRGGRAGRTARAQSPRRPRSAPPAAPPGAPSPSRDLVSSRSSVMETSGVPEASSSNASARCAGRGTHSTAASSAEPSRRSPRDVTRSPSRAATASARAGRTSATTTSTSPAPASSDATRAPVRPHPITKTRRAIGSVLALGAPAQR